MITSGIGYDVHRLEKGRKMILGGVEIPFEKGIIGHSDGDVLCHAIIDAILGAVNLGDIGQHFPSDDERWKDTSSLILLEKISSLIRKKGFKIHHIDCTIILQTPKLWPHLAEMKKNIGKSLKIKTSQVSLKATTPDFLGFIGEGKGIASLAIATLSTASRP